MAYTLVPTADEIIDELRKKNIKIFINGTDEFTHYTSYEVFKSYIELKAFKYIRKTHIEQSQSYKNKYPTIWDYLIKKILHFEDKFNYIKVH